MRIATSTAYSQSVAAMNTQNYKLNKTRLQLSTGQRIITPADDPAAAARVLGLNQAQSRTEQFQDNISVLKSSLQVEETALDGIVNILQRVRELSLQGNNDTYDAEQRNAIALEIEQHFEAITGLANSSDGNGEFLFSGFNSRNQPFVYNSSTETVEYEGDQGQKLIQISATRQVASGDNGFDAFMNIKNTDNGDAADNYPMSVFSIVKELQTTLENGNAPDFHDSMSRIMVNIDAALGQIVDLQSGIGARINATDSQENVNADYLVQLASTLSDTQDLDYTEAISRLEQEQLGLQASQQAFMEIQGLSLFNYL